MDDDDTDDLLLVLMRTFYNCCCHKIISDYESDDDESDNEESSRGTTKQDLMRKRYPKWQPTEYTYKSDLIDEEDIPKQSVIHMCWNNMHWNE